MERVKIINNQGVPERYAYIPEINGFVSVSSEAVRFAQGEDIPEVKIELEELLNHVDKVPGWKSLFVTHSDSFPSCRDANNNDKRTLVFLDLTAESNPNECVPQLESMLSEYCNKVYVITSFNGERLDELAEHHLDNQIVVMSGADFLRLSGELSAVESSIILEVEVNSAEELDRIVAVPIPRNYVLMLVFRVISHEITEKLLHFYRNLPALSRQVYVDRIQNFKSWINFKVNKCYSDSVFLYEDGKEDSLSSFRGCANCFAKQFCWHTGSYMLYGRGVSDVNCDFIKQFFEVMLSFSVAKQSSKGFLQSEKTIIEFSKDGFDIQLINP